MTTSATTPRLSYVADGSTVQYTFNFEIADSSSIAVYVGSTLKTLTTDYTVAFDSGTSGTGTITLLSAPADGSIIYLVRDTYNVRSTDFEDSGAFLASTVNNELDRLTQGLQDLENRLDNRVLESAEPNDESARDLTIPNASTRANKTLTFDASGDVQMSDAAGSVTSVGTGTGLTGGPITTSGTISIDSTVATLTGTQTLTNKTINSASNTITITESNISDLGNYITASSTDTLTNKTMGDNLDVDSNRIVNVGTAVAGTDAVNKSYVDDQVSAVSTSSISTGNTSATVTDSGSDGQFTVVADGNTELTITDTASTFSGTVETTSTSAGAIKTPTIQLDGNDNTITSIGTNKSLGLQPTGTGDVYATSDIIANGDLIATSQVKSPALQLGGDGNDQDAYIQGRRSNENITIDPAGTGTVELNANTNVTGTLGTTGAITAGGNIAMGGNQITGLDTSGFPLADSDAATKLYVDDATAAAFQTSVPTLQTGTTMVTTGVPGPSNTIQMKVSGNEEMTIRDDGVRVHGNLTVDGTQTILNTATLSVEDNIITVNRNVSAVSGMPATSGLEINRGADGTNATLLWNETDDRWDISGTVSTAIRTASITDQGSGIDFNDKNLTNVGGIVSNSYSAQSGQDFYIGLQNNLAEAFRIVNSSGQNIITIDAGSGTDGDTINFEGNINTSYTASRPFTFSQGITLNSPASIRGGGGANIQIIASGGGAIQLSGGSVAVYDSFQTIGDDSHIENESIRINAGSGLIEGLRSNEDISIQPAGTGKVILGAIKIDGTTISSDDSTQITIAENIQTTGSLDTNAITGTTIDASTDVTTPRIETASGDLTIVPGSGGSTTIENINGAVNLGNSGSFTIFSNSIHRFQDKAVWDQNLEINDNYIKTTASNSDLELSASGTGKVSISGDLWPTSGAINGYVLQTDGAGNLSWSPASGSTGDLTIVGSTISSPSNGDLTLQTTGTGNVVLENLTVNNDGAVVTAIKDEDNFASNSATALATQQSIKAYVDTQDEAIASDTLTFTNKTFDANATGNSISNIEVTDLAGSAVVTAAEGIASNNNDTTIPTSAAVKAYADSVASTATGLTFVGDDSTGTLISDGETIKIAGGTNITTAMSGDTLTITGPDLTSYLTAETNDLTSAVTWANVPDANITQSSVTQHQAALSITESQISDLQSYITDANITIVGDDSTGVTFSAKNNDDITITGTGGITSTVSGNTITIDGSGVSGGGAATGLTFVGDDSTGTLIADGETVKIAGGTGITTAMSGDTLTITASGSASTGDFVFTGNNMSTGSSNADTEIEASGTGRILLQANGAPDLNAGELETWTTSDYRVAGATHITDVITGITPGNREYKYDSTFFKTDGTDSASGSARFRKLNQVVLDLNGSELTATGGSRGLQIQDAILSVNSDTVNTAVLGNHGGHSIWSVVGNDGGSNFDGNITATTAYGFRVNTATVTNNASTTISVTNAYGVDVNHSQYGPGTQTTTNYTAFNYSGGGNAATNTPYLLNTSDDKMKTRPGALEKFNEWAYTATHSSGGTYTVDWANGNLQTVTLTSNITSFTMSNFPTDTNQSVGITLYLVQDGTGSRTMSFTAGSGETFKFANGANTSSVSLANDIQTVYIFSKYNGSALTYYWTLGPTYS